MEPTATMSAHYGQEHQLHGARVETVEPGNAGVYESLELLDHRLTAAHGLVDALEAIVEHVDL